MGVPDSLHDGQLARFEQIGEAAQRGVKTVIVVDLQHLAGAVIERKAVAMISVVAIGDDRVQPIVAAGELHNDKHVLAPAAGGFARRRAAQKRRNRMRQCDNGRRTGDGQKRAACGLHWTLQCG